VIGRLDEVRHERNDVFQGPPVADDEAEIRDLVALALEPAGYDAETAIDGEEALSRIRACPTDAVVLDVMMPCLGGYEVARALVAEPRTAALLVVMLSAKCQATDVKAGLASGARVYLVKPFAPQELVRQVNRLVAQRRASAGLVPMAPRPFAIAS
jgi:DNA-binding response OmpR family regulator